MGIWPVTPVGYGDMARYTRGLGRFMPLTPVGLGRFMPLTPVGYEGYGLYTTRVMRDMVLYTTRVYTPGYTTIPPVHLLGIPPAYHARLHRCTMPDC